MTTDSKRVEGIAGRLSKITKWPWVYFGAPYVHVFWGEARSSADDGNFAHICDTPENDERGDDMEFIAHAPDDIDYLLAEVDRLNALTSNGVIDFRKYASDYEKEFSSWLNDDGKVYNLGDCAILINEQIKSLRALLAEKDAEIARFESPNGEGECRFCGNQRDAPRGSVQKCYCIPTIRQYIADVATLTARLAELEGK